MQKDLRAYQAELTNARAKIWPGLAGSLNQGLAGGGLAAIVFNFLGGAGYVLCGSIVAASLTFLKSTLDVKLEMEKAKRSASPGVSYLSTLLEAMPTHGTTIMMDKSVKPRTSPR